jgi:anti-sigma factor RsiW
VTPAAPLHDDELLELLDAYLDDELTDEERGAVDGLLVGSAEARAELAAIDRVRSVVRGLPDVDAPFGFYERLTRSTPSARRRGTHRRRAPGVVFSVVGAVAAAIVLVVAIAPVTDRFAPPVEELTERHAMLASATPATPEGYTSMAADDLDHMSEPYEMPAAAANGYEPMAAYRAPEGLHLVYRNGASIVSVFEQKGHVRWTGLPDAGSRLTMDGDQAWAMTMPTADVVVLARDGLVVTVLGGAHDDVVALAEAVPDPPSPSLPDRMGEACAWVARGFGFPD